MVGPLSIQETLYPDTTCFGCGHANPHGLHLRSFRDGDGASAEFTPWAEHDNGFGFLNGGIISTVLDCHGAAMVMSEADTRGWEAPEGAPIPFITAGFDVKFLRPTPLGPSVRLLAFTERVAEDEIVVRSELEFEERTRAVMVASWKRFRPRTAS